MRCRSDTSGSLKVSTQRTQSAHRRRGSGPSNTLNVNPEEESHMTGEDLPGNERNIYSGQTTTLNKRIIENGNSFVDQRRINEGILNVPKIELQLQRSNSSTPSDVETPKAKTIDGQRITWQQVRSCLL